MWAEAAPLAAPDAVAAKALSVNPIAEVVCGEAVVAGCLLTTAGWEIPPAPLAGFTGADDGALANGGGGGNDVDMTGVAGRRSDP